MTINVTFETVRNPNTYTEGDTAALVDLIYDAIHANNSVGFLLTTSKSELHEFWEQELHDAANTFVIARANGVIVGVVIVTRETRPNGRHRAELRKLIVHSDYQQKGIGRGLEQRASDFAQREGITLLYLDSATDFLIERVYEAWGWQKAGSIPDYSSKPDGTLEPTTYFYKLL
jgi:GNAT superfamily N-acetyltransferase